MSIMACQEPMQQHLHSPFYVQGQKAERCATLHILPSGKPVRLLRRGRAFCPVAQSPVFFSIRCADTWLSGSG